MNQISEKLMEKATNSEISLRFHEQLRAYWKELKGDRKFPSENEIDPDAIKDLWPSCFLIAIDSVTARLGYRYSYLGDDLVEAFGTDSPDPDIAIKLMAEHNQSLISKFDTIVGEQCEAVDEGEFVNLKKLNVRYRTCALPLGADGKVTHILGVMRWRIY